MTRLVPKRSLLLLFATAVVLGAHPMGSFSISHYAKLQVVSEGLRSTTDSRSASRSAAVPLLSGGAESRPVLASSGIELEYVLDFAEIPTMDLLRAWNVERNAPHQELERKATEQAGKWLENLRLASNGRSVKAKLRAASVVLADGAGGLPVLRVVSRAHVAADPGKFTYEDGNYPERAGWKEIVTAHGPGTVIRVASQSNRDLSKGLTAYPADPTIAPPQDLRASVEWTAAGPVQAAQLEPQQVAPVVQPKQAFSPVAPVARTSVAAPAGSIVRGDFLSRLLAEKELSLPMMALALGVALVLGGAHALTPGHGKTVVAAYLVGSRGTLKHAAFLGATVTFTHTISVFALGLATLFLFQYVVPEKITQWLGAISGLSIVALGAWMLVGRIRKYRHDRAHRLGTPHHHPHTHDHPHAHEHHHTHDHHHGHEHHHHHGPGGHSHVPDDISWRGLAALGVSGGLVPCESALVLLLGAIALNRVGLGLLLLVAFSLGLAAVLTAIGVLFVFARNLIPESGRLGNSMWLRWISIASPAVVMLVGLVTTAASLGFV